jgi:glycosyltransferase involved in cell wall biosynthesis
MGRLGKWSNSRKMRKLFYFGLEPLKARYTYQLSKEWMPATFEPYANELEFIDVEGEFAHDQQIKIGAVLDAVGRGKFAMSQCANFLDMLNRDEVNDGDIIFLQDYWHPGIESILYAIDLYGIDLKIYSMLHAQSVDEYDFTYPMRNWMRGFELGLDKRMTGIFIGSTVHKEQLREAGFTAPIHVVSLPIHKEATLAKLPGHDSLDKQDVIVYSSRLDKEKNPFFMMEVAKEFLKQKPDFEWHVTTSGKEFRSMLPGAIDALNKLAKEEPRFKLLNGLTKEEYYTELATCRIQFNSALQDYVSWTVIEATAFGADIVYPNFRSFPEFIDSDRMYKPFDVQSAIDTLHDVLDAPKTHYDIVDTSDLGRQMEGYIIANDYDKEICVWHEKEYCKHLLKTQGKYER